jgi:hypothetical protein
MSDDTTPKPCPFCGEPAAAAEHIAGPYFGCMNNDCDGALASGFMPPDGWNTRPIEDALRARAEAAEAALATARAEGVAAERAAVVRMLYEYRDHAAAHGRPGEAAVLAMVSEVIDAEAHLDQPEGA